MKKKKKKEKIALSQEELLIFEQIKEKIDNKGNKKEISNYILGKMGKSESLDLAILDILGKTPDKNNIDILKSYILTNPPKKTLKAAKKALYQLKLKGIKVVEPIKIKTPSFLFKTPAIEPSFAMLASIDPIGSQPLLLGIQVPKYGTRLTYAVNNFQTGIEKFMSDFISRKNIKNIVDNLKKEEDYNFFDADPFHTAFLIKEGIEKRKERGMLIQSEMKDLITIIDKIKPFREKPIIYDIFNEKELKDSDSIRALNRNIIDFFLENPLSIGILLSEDIIRKYYQQTIEIEESILILDKSQKMARFDDIIKKAAVEIFDENMFKDYK
ncbi:MAG: hypothetical protein JRI44_13070, partial [Deltaproteobacteria bacterium]|nr:hypothetical protein [Deltaproteobacteria bacterium]